MQTPYIVYFDDDPLSFKLLAIKGSARDAKGRAIYYTTRFGRSDPAMHRMELGTLGKKRRRVSRLLLERMQGLAAIKKPTPFMNYGKLVNRVMEKDMAIPNP